MPTWKSSVGVYGLVVVQTGGVVPVVRVRSAENRGKAAVDVGLKCVQLWNSNPRF